MKRQKLTEYESRRLADAIAAEVRAMGLHGRVRMPQETRRRIREQVLKIILAEREADKKTGSGTGAGSRTRRHLQLAATASPVTVMETETIEHNVLLRAQLKRNESVSGVRRAKVVAVKPKNHRKRAR